ncbi:MAG: DNA polymerase III subunit alpha [Melioribacteraceae bacterium]|nr:DNA polymerase III subunit alpha [Melioribacteraceae bacterium]MCF8355725.1 DNA polymerase III subunit alpha [Melioribacteraceae bacterium]MCF8393843.1 DNA polymerase III subunit alpha [Melioribacteraceae bacterium]MCF8418216.1 DNA polymerase III subunit alpha [Melioribacteraceae bacterium]
MSDFVHLHNHSHYSLQDAAATIDGLIDAAVKNNMHALALTDHGVMYGVSEFHKKAKKAGIKPLIGMEAYIVNKGTRFDRGESSNGSGRKKSKHYNHLILLAKNKTGYKNLIKLATIGHTEGFYYKPRIDYEVLRKYSEGLICTSACPAGPISVHLINDDFEKAKEAALLYHEIFGDDFYLEIQDHSLEIEQPILKGMPKLSKELGIKLIATNDIHYIEQQHSIAHNILLLLGDKTGTADYQSLRYKTDQVYFKSTEQMKQLFKNYDGAIENTLEIADKIDLNLDFEEFHYPNFPIPENSTAKNLDEYFEQLSRKGLEERFDKIDQEIEDRFKYEIGVITSMGYSGYFLITQDFINAAKKRGIPVGPGRGSAAGSLVAYALGITNVNPLDYDLLFERFLNPARKSMPDIDVDFADDQRGDIIEYVKNKYGENSVCQIITFNRLSSKAVIRDVARVLKIPIPQVNEITKWIPSKFGKVFTIDEALDKVPELKPVRDSKDPVIQELIQYSRILEGMNRNASKHAAGVVIAPGEVSDYVPLARAGSDADIVTQFNMKELDNAGLLKMDFLGLRTLTIIRDTLSLVEKNYNKKLDIDDIPLDDEKTYKLFSKGQTTAVFQFESGAMREYLKKLRPTSIKDLAAMNALYRPGPMDFIDDFIDRRHGRKKIEYLHPVLENILKETYGIIVYQEQVIQIANKVAGMSLAEADLLRRAMGKKDLAAMKEQKKKFIEGAVKNKISKKIAEEIFANIDKFANYGFNKSHAVAYSVVAYQTAYLKAHYLAEFLAANLTNEFGNADKVTVLLDDCRKLKVKVLSPHVNKPSVTFNVENGNIIFGMSAIKNVGKNAVLEMMRAREELGREFKSIFDFACNVDTRIVNKRAFEGLVLAGAFDNLGLYRSQNFSLIEEALEYAHKYQSAKQSQTNSLFGESEDIKIPVPDPKDVEPWDTKEKLAREREVLGFYLSDHPLRKYESIYKSFATVNLGVPETFENKEQVRACGVVTEIRTKIDRSNNTMAFFKLDDLSGSCECLMFAKIYSEFGKHLYKEATVLVNGRLESSGDAIKLHAEEVIPLDEVHEKLTKELYIVLDIETHTPEHIKEIKKILESNSGKSTTYLCVRGNGTSRDFYIEYKSKVTQKLIDELTELLGEDSVNFG